MLLSEFPTAILFLGSANHLCPQTEARKIDGGILYRSSAPLYTTPTTMANIFNVYYVLPQVPENATQEEIKKAFRLKAKQFHPDVNKDDPDAQQKFNEVSLCGGAGCSFFGENSPPSVVFPLQVNKAYEILGDETQRRAFDSSTGRWRSAGGTWSMGSNAHHKAHARWRGDDFAAFGMGFEDFMHQTTGGGPRQDTSNEDDNFESETSKATETKSAGDVKLTFVEAAKGCQKVNPTILVPSFAGVGSAFEFE